MPKFRKKPVIIDAVRFTGNNSKEIIDFCGNTARFVYADALAQTGNQRLAIETLEGTMYVDEGDWVIKGVKGEFYPCKPDIFEATYTAMEASP